MLSDWLDAEEVQARWSWLRPTHGALWAPHEGALEPQKLVRALLADAQRLGVELTHDRATGIERQGDRVACVVGQRDRYPAGDVVLAAGAWSGLLDGLPRPLSVSPVRGQMVALPWPEREPGAPSSIGAIATWWRAGDEAIAGSTMEYVGFRPEVTDEGRASITGALATLSAALDGEVLRSWSGLRPVTPDGLPILGAEPRLGGLWYATGHGRHGILLAGLTGVLIRQLLDGEPPAEDLTAFAPDRFWKW